MSIEKGSVSIRVFKSKPGTQFPADVVARLAKDAIPPVDMITSEGCVGWATGRHLLDRNITAESVIISNKLRVALVKAEKKIPAALFKAECKQEELAAMAATGSNFLKRAERCQIAKEVRERMLPKMPPTISGIDFVQTKDGCYTSAISDTQADLLMTAWLKATGQQLIPYTPAAAAGLLANLDTRILNSTSFSSAIDDEIVEQDIGTEFLTWLWYFSEACGGMDKNFGFALEGPFTFVHEGEGAFEIIVRKGNPGIASEAKSALVAGKKLKKAKLTIAQGNELWSCTLNGSEWTFGSLKLPKGEAKDALTNFDERLLFIDRFIEAIESVYKKFLAIRVDKKLWDVEVTNIRQWVTDRATRA